MPFEKDSEIVVDVPTDDIVLSEVTDENGVAIFELDYGDYVATITKDGYATNTENIAFRSNHKNFTITIEAEPTPTIQIYDCALYQSESGGEAVFYVPSVFTGEVENNRKEVYWYNMFTTPNPKVWVDENAVLDGTTRNPVYLTSTSTEIGGYVSIELLEPIGDYDVEFTCEDGESFKLDNVDIVLLDGDTVIENGNTGEEYGLTFTNIPFGVYTITANTTYDGRAYSFTHSIAITQDYLDDNKLILPLEPTSSQELAK